MIAIKNIIVNLRNIAFIKIQKNTIVFITTNNDFCAFSTREKGPQITKVSKQELQKIKKYIFKKSKQIINLEEE